MEIKLGSGLSHNPNRKQRASRKWDEALLLKALPSDVLSLAVLYILRCYSHTTHVFVFKYCLCCKAWIILETGHEFGNML